MSGPAAAQGAPSNLPRNQTLILDNPEGTVENAGWFHIWAINAGSQSNGLQQVALDTLWYIDPEHGIDSVWDNSLAAEKPIYNDDFTEMTAKLRRGIYWSDGVEFTAADVIYPWRPRSTTAPCAGARRWRLTWPRWRRPIRIRPSSS